jgi:multidrug resistance protein, MATE family
MLLLALPLILAEIGWMMMGVVDTIMVGRLPDAAIAIGAVSLSSVFYYAITVFGGALLLGLDTLVSQSFGANQIADCHRSFWSAIYLVAVIAPVGVFLNWLSAGLFSRFGIQPAVAVPASAYMLVLNWGAPPLFLYFAMRRYLQGMGAVKIIGFSLVSANIINLVANWAFIYGHLGMPAMGLNGSAWSTVASRYYMAAVLIGYTIYSERRHSAGLFDVSLRPDFKRMRRLLALGFPAATHTLAEIAVFGLATVLIARLSPEILAAHQIALTLASMTFMVPFGISSAAAVRVGHRIGAGDPEGAGRSGYAAIAIAASFMMIAGIAFWLVPEPLARIYTNDSRVVKTSVSLLAIAAVFQLFDGIQITSAGALRGAGDTHTAMFCNLGFYWLVGMPIGYRLCFNYGYGAVGVWSGLCLALVLIGSVLLVVWHRKVTSLTHSLPAT